MLPVRPISVTFTSVLAALAVSTVAFAQDPGSRIRSGSTFDSLQPPTPPASDLAERCQKTRGAERERCMREVKRRDEAQDTNTKPSGPESTGMASGAASITGPSGGAAPGMTAPR